MIKIKEEGEKVKRAVAKPRCAELKKELERLSLHAVWKHKECCVCDEPYGTCAQFRHWKVKVEICKTLIAGYCDDEKPC